VVESWAKVLEKTATHYTRCRELEESKIRKEYLTSARISGAALQELNPLFQQKLGKERYRRIKTHKAQNDTSVQLESTHGEDKNMLELKNLLRIILDDYNDKEDELQRELAKRDAELNVLTERLSTSEAKVEKLRSEREAELRSGQEEAAIRLQQKELAYDATRDRLSSEIAEVNRTLAEKNTELRATRVKFEETLSRIRDLEAALQAAEDQRRCVESELAIAKVDVDQVPALQDTIHRLQADISACWLHRFKKWLRRARRPDDQNTAAGFGRV